MLYESRLLSTWVGVQEALEKHTTAYVVLDVSLACFRRKLYLMSRSTENVKNVTWDMISLIMIAD